MDIVVWFVVGFLVTLMALGTAFVFLAIAFILKSFGKKGRSDAR